MYTNDILALLDSFTMEDAGDIQLQMARDFKARRIEKGLTQRDVAKQSEMSLSNITRFEQSGRISLTNLIKLAMTLGYTSEIKSIFSSPKYTTMAELQQIRRNTGKKKAHRK